MRSVQDVINSVTIPINILEKWDKYPHVRTFIGLLRSGQAERAYIYYERFTKEGSFLFDERQNKTRKNRKTNLRNRKKYGPNWSKKVKDIKLILHKKQDGRCSICKNYFNIRYFSVDHIVRLGEGGKNEIDNMQLLCLRCHREKDRDFCSMQGAIGALTDGEWMSPKYKQVV